jgi:aryl sulfotransferase
MGKPDAGKDDFSHVTAFVLAAGVPTFIPMAIALVLALSEGTCAPSVTAITSAQYHGHSCWQCTIPDDITYSLTIYIKHIEAARPLPRCSSMLRFTQTKAMFFLAMVAIVVPASPVALAKTPNRLVLAHGGKARIEANHPLRGTRPAPRVNDHHLDSSAWTHPKFELRKGDIIVSTVGKSGTTWTQQVATQIVHGGHEVVGKGLPYKRLYDVSPWVEAKAIPAFIRMPMMEKLPGRRVFKTHLSLEELPYSPDVTYLAVQRDPRDAAVSMWEHWNNMTLAGRLIFRGTPRPPKSFETYWSNWIKDGSPFWNPWEHMVAAWRAKDLPNVELIHFADMKRDLPAVVKRIAKTAEVDLDRATIDRIVHHASFDYMKENQAAFAPPALIFKSGRFINKGTNRRWKDRATPTMLQEYQSARDKGLAPLGKDQKAATEWLENGGSSSSN